MSQPVNERVSAGRIFVFWIPLAATWLMMAVEGPFLAAIIARLSDPKENLAAYGVAFAVAILLEAPVMMLLSASTALVEDAGSFRKLKNFTYALNGLLTGIMALLLLTPLWIRIARDLIGLPPEVADLTQAALVLMLPWPGAIGYRRFYQGVLIRYDLTRRVAYGTVIRLVSMGLTAFAFYQGSDLPGAQVGAIALTVGVTIEALASRWMAAGVIRRLRDSGRTEAPGREPLTYRKILIFYYPLALTTTITMAAHPVVTFFMGRAPYSIESLAVLPVVYSLVFVFRSLGLSFQEVAITMLARGDQNRRPVGRFAILLALFTAGGLALIAWTPLATIWFQRISGLTPELTAFALPPLRILMVMPALTVLLSMQRALLVHGRATGPVTLGTLIEMAGIVATLFLVITLSPLVGATAAGIAWIAGRIFGNLYLVPPCLRQLAPDHPPAVPAGACALTPTDGLDET